MPALQSVQRGSKTITAADGLTVTQAISAVTVANAIVMFTFRSGDAGPREKRHQFKAVITSTTQITFTRFESGFATDVIIEWSVVEFAAGALQSLQTGTVNCTAAPTDITVSAIALARAFPILNGSTARSSSYDDELGPTASFSSTTNLRLTFDSVPATDDANVAWQIVEFKSADASVQSGSISYDNATPTTATITAVDTTQTLVSASYRGGNTAAVRSNARVDLNSSTTIKAQMQNFGTAISGVAEFFAVEMTDGSVVQYGRAQIPNAATVPASQPTWGSAMTNGAVFSAYMRPLSYISSAADGNPTDVQFTVALGSPQSSATITRVGTTTNVEVAWQVVEWAASGGVTAALTNVLGTGSAGSLGVTVSLALTGAAGTGSTGSTTATNSPALTGTSATASPGTVAPTSTVATTGTAGTSAVGSVGVSVAPPLTGITATSAVGSIGVVITVGLTGAGATGAVGTITAISGAGAAITGVGGTGSTGSASVSISVALTGTAATGSVGTLNVAGAVQTTATTASVTVFTSPDETTVTLVLDATTVLTVPDEITVTATGEA